MEDDQIVGMFLRREPDAIEAVSQKYGAYCQYIAGNILENTQDVEECLNDVYLQLWNAIPPHEPQNLAAFAGKLVRNTAFNRYRSDHTQKRGDGSVPLVLDELTELLSDPNTLERTIDRKLITEALNGFLSTLPQWKRYILIRRYWYADSVSAIAQACHKSEGHISMTLTRLRRKMKEYLTERGIEL